MQKYVRSIHAGYTRQNDGIRLHFGDRTQHDTEEFGQFILSQLGEETSINATKARSKGFDFEKYEKSGVVPKRHMDDFWDSLCAEQDSIYLKYWGFMGTWRITCASCNWVGFRFEVNTSCIVPLEHAVGTRKVNLTKLKDSLDVDLLREEPVEVHCGGCTDPHAKKTRSHRISRMPPLLRMTLKRFNDLGGKLDHPYEFPLRDLDLAPYKLETSSEPDRDSWS